MQVVILCGGQGTRLREETEYRPKPMVGIGGRPILWHIMKIYASYGFVDFILCLGYRGEMIIQYFLNYDAMNSDLTVCLGRKKCIDYHTNHNEQDYHVTLAETGLTTMTGARLKRIEKYLQGDTFMVTYGDGLSDLNITDLLRFHQSHGKLATVTSVQPMSRLGMLEIDDSGQVTSFTEKQPVKDWASAGFFVFNRPVLDYLSDDPACVLEQEPLQRLVADGELVAYRHRGFFYGMDTYRDYLYLNSLWDKGDVPWKVW